jgi:hypothetical protein
MRELVRKSKAEGMGLQLAAMCWQVSFMWENG